MTTPLLYCRVSTQEQADEGYSLAAQLRQLEAFCDSQGWQVAGRYIEEGQSASRLERPQLRALLADLAAGQRADPCILVWRLDRLTRSVADLYTLLSVFERSGCTFKSITEPFETRSAVGKLFITLIAAMAQWERENLIERVHLGRTHQATMTGDWLGGPAPYGYLLRDRRLVVDEGRAAVVRQIYERFLREGNLSALARAFDARGIPAPGARGWTATRLRYILTNPTYAGIRTWQRHARPSDGVGGYRRLPREAWLTIDQEGPPAIVPLVVWERAYDALDRRARVSRARGWGEHPLTGVLVCGACRSPMSGRRAVRGRTAYRYYRCPGRYQRGRCARRPVRADALEGLTLGAVRAAFGAHDLIERALAASEDGEAGDARHRLALALASVRRRVRRWQDAYENGAIDVRTLGQRLRDLRDEEREVVGRMASGRAPTLASPTDALADGWAAMTAAERRAFVGALIERIVVHPGGAVEIEWR